jgi:mono/diheme cytochrome c family protein
MKNVPYQSRGTTAMKQPFKLVEFIIGITVTVSLCILCGAPGGIAKPKTQKISGSLVFKQHCAQCHTGGGNKVNPKKPVAGSGKLNSLVTFRDYLRSPLGHMPYYKHIVTDRKMLNALYKYCKSLPVSEQS